MARNKLAKQILNVKEGAVCSICKNPVRGNVNPEKILTCGKCVQILLSATKENKIAFRDSLLEKGDTEGARSIESFITPEEEIIDEPTRKFRRTLERKRPLRKIRYPHG